MALRLAKLAALLERRDEAEAYFEIALERRSCSAPGRCGRECCSTTALPCRRRGGPAMPSEPPASSPRHAASSEDLGLAGLFGRIDRLELSGQPVPSPEARFVREGDFWTIAYDGTTMRLRDQGPGYLALLLARPGRDLHVLELVAADGGTAPDQTGIAGEGLHPGRPAGLDPFVDARAKHEYRVRIEELRGDLEEARRFNDDERVALLEVELDALVGELARAAGLEAGAGRLDPAERARERDEGDPHGDQADGAGIASTRAAPQRLGADRPLLQVTRLRVRRHRAGSLKRRGTTVPSDSRLRG